MVWIDLTHIHTTIVHKYAPNHHKDNTDSGSSSMTAPLMAKPDPLVIAEHVAAIVSRWKEYMSASHQHQAIGHECGDLVGIMERASRAAMSHNDRNGMMAPSNVGSNNSSERFGFFLLEATPFVDQYCTILKAQRKVSFMQRQAGAVIPLTSLDDISFILRQYMKVVERHYPADMNLFSVGTEPTDATSLRKRRPTDAQDAGSMAAGVVVAPTKATRRTVELVCTECKAENQMIMDLTHQSLVCEHCGFVNEPSATLQVSFKDIDRVNISSKYQYDRITHFRDCMNQFQGKQNSSIDPKVYESLRYQFLQHGLIPADYERLPKEVAFANITKEHILLFLKETGHTKHYDDVVLIHYELSGKRPPDIHHLENLLLQDFQKLTTLYDKKYRQSERKNFINTGYILYQLLKRHRFPCKKEDFNILKTIDRKYYHDNITKALFEELGWNFAPTF